MKRTMAVMCVLFVLAWVTADALGQGKGKDRPGRPTDRVANPDKKAEAARPDADATAADAKGSPNANKGGKGKTKEALDQVQSKGKAAKDATQGAKGPADKAQGGKGQQHQQQLAALQKQMQHETAKHMERQARLNRIRELAVQKGDKDMIARVDKLIAKENEVNSRKLEQLQQQHRALLGGAVPQTNVAPPVGKKGKEKVDVNKPAEKPAEAKPAEANPAETKPPEAKPQEPPAPAPAPENPPAQEKPAEQPKPQ